MFASSWPLVVFLPWKFNRGGVFKYIFRVQHFLAVDSFRLAKYGNIGSGRGIGLCLGRVIATIFEACMQAIVWERGDNPIAPSLVQLVATVYVSNTKYVNNKHTYVGIETVTASYIIKYYLLFLIIHKPNRCLYWIFFFFKRWLMGLKLKLCGSMLIS